MDIRHADLLWKDTAATEKEVADVERMYRRGVMTEDERYRKVIELWQRAYEEVGNATEHAFDKFSPIWMMMGSGARGNIQQIRQLAGMRGLMADPTGRIIDLPIQANFTEGLTVLEYFISTHGTRKGLADTALRTADSGYLTRRLVDVAQDVIVRVEDCGTTNGIWIRDITPDRARNEPIFEKIAGRVAAEDVSAKGKVLVPAGQSISDEVARKIIEAGVPVKMRSVLVCEAGEEAMEGQELARDPRGNGIRTRHAGKVAVSAKEITVRTVDEEVREYAIPHQVRIRPELDRRDGHKVLIKAGQQITEGSISPQELLHILGKEAVQTFLVDEVQKVYRAQGVVINGERTQASVGRVMRKLRRGLR